MRVLPLLLLLASGLAAHDIITTKLTYTRDISRIFEKRCMQCHGAGASIPLTTYEEVRPWAVGIKEQVLSRNMPPWGAVKGFGNLASDGALAQEEIMIIAAWVIGGAPEGDKALLSKPVEKTQASPARMLKDGLNVQTRAELKEPVSVAGVRPTGNVSVESARIIAKLPGGRVEPLIWLYHFDPKIHASFNFKSPLLLPAGTTVEASVPLAFALETAP